ncbi:MAG: hypothetical protein ACYDHP_00545 [Ferrimicrobium sp.]
MANLSTLLDNLVITASGQTTGFNIGNETSIGLVIDVSAASGTSPSMALSLLWSDDGTHWATDASAALGTYTAVGGGAVSVPVKGELFAVAYAVTGTTPSFTVTIDAEV